MIKDITLGQYFPGDSVIHRLDPRAKIIMTFFYIVSLFLIRNIIGYVPVLLFTAWIIYTSKISFKMVVKSVKPILLIIVITALLNVFYTSGDVLVKWGFLTITYQGIFLAIFMTLRLIFLIVGTSMLTYTTSPIMLTDAIENLLRPLKRFKLPVHELAMMMTIALRFIPTLIEETDKIISAQKARGADFETGNLVKRSKALIPLLVPLFISAFRRADELAIAMECRCYRGDEGRTRLKQLKFGPIDMKAGIVFVLIVALFIIPNYLKLGYTL